MRIAKQFAEQTARVAENTLWRGPKGAQACLTARRAPVGSTHSVFVGIGDRSSLFMNNPYLGVCAVEKIPTTKSPQRSIFVLFFVA